MTVLTEAEEAAGMRIQGRSEVHFGWELPAEIGLLRMTVRRAPTCGYYPGQRSTSRIRNHRGTCNYSGAYRNHESQESAILYLPRLPDNTCIFLCPKGQSRIRQDGGFLKIQNVYPSSAHHAPDASCAVFHRRRLDR